jgi:hypothetical protein
MKSGQFHMKGTTEGFSTNLDSTQLGLWISRYRFMFGKDTLSNIKCHKYSRYYFGKPVALHVG